MAAKQRPLSPHLGIYKKQITSVLSIMHRAAGVVNAIGGLAVAAWLVIVASSPECFAWSQQIFASWFGKFALFIFSASLIYHLLNGIRHLLWDIGWGMEIQQVPLNISVLSREFLDDTNAKSLTDLFRYSAASSGDTRFAMRVPANEATPQGGFTMRGFSVNTLMRDGIFRYTAYSLDNTERVEVVKGPGPLCKRPVQN